MADGFGATPPDPGALSHPAERACWLTCSIVVILADRPKQEMDSDCQQGLAGLGLEVDTRTGVPYSVDDLKKVAAGSARTVLLLTDKHHEVRCCS